MRPFYVLVISILCAVVSSLPISDSTMGHMTCDQNEPDIIDSPANFLERRGTVPTHIPNLPKVTRTAAFIGRKYTNAAISKSNIVIAKLFTKLRAAWKAVRRPISKLSRQIKRPFASSASLVARMVGATGKNVRSPIGKFMNSAKAPLQHTWKATMKPIKGTWRAAKGPPVNLWKDIKQSARRTYQKATTI